MARMIRRLIQRSLAVGLVFAGTTVAADEDASAGSSVIPAAAAPGVLSLARFDPQTPALPPDGVEAFETVVVIDGRPHEIVMRRRSVRAPSFRVLVQVEGGAFEEKPPPPVRTYRGEVRGAPGSLVAASLIDGRLSALAVMPDGSGWSLQPADELLPGLPRLLHLGFDLADVLPDLGTCGAADLAPLFEEAEGPAAAPEGGNEPNGERMAELAFDTDVEFFQRVGGSQRDTIYDIERVVNAMNVIYRRDVRIDHSITTVLVRTEEPDPYTSSDIDTLLCQFRDHWNEDWTSIPRDTAHLMTGRALNGTDIGLAWVGVICNRVGLADVPCRTTANLAYGLSQSIQNVFAQRVALTAHEVGHNWGADHCDGDADCAIMCASLGGCTGLIDRFGIRSINSIVDHRNSRNCLFTCDPFVNVPSESATITDALIRACWDGVISIQAGNYGEFPRMPRRVELRAVGGPVVIGD